ncbi:apses-domain-containing protein [Pseudovirgaria hyperparasitica]|uniref:Apses-domain-containing protein n=1 Tax=Pseudovirgaria hyperparasitica TaxID=470096 RepID=A0A6A6WB20_9PEZI|nr:apses-domain-containing protein [Pseudovirgaria hyperparasitica]KAF2760048.1 apses-domain-containing protein [Pseudovirgaria hyperparasitica]
MTTMQQYGDVHQPHSSSLAHAPPNGAQSSMSHYPSQYQQPPILQHGQPSYGSQSQYGHAYSNGVPSGYQVQSHMNPSVAPLPAMSTSGPGSTLPASQYNGSHTFDQTGQVAPPGMKPRVTATLWEDEGTLCFQVEAKGICVARREDNHMINGTKLLNVAGMTRGRRDGILKSEKVRHVVKIGPMHLKGVWIPYERALEFANKEKITESLYPLFVHDIGSLLYHPSNQNGRTSVSATMTAVEQSRRRPDQRYIGAPQTSQSPSLHHHHSMSSSIPSHMPQPNSIAPHPNAARPGLDRAHTFPTPPASASSIMAMGSQGNSYEWNSPSVSNMQNGQPLSIDTGISNTRSVPTTPASTPPGAMQNMAAYSTTQGYDSSRQLYSAPPAQQGQYSAGPPPVDRYSQPMQGGVYPKTEMAPPSRTATEQDHHAETKPSEALLNQASSGHDDEAEHESEYTHTSAPYNSSRNYSYAATNGVHGETAHLSPDMTGSPHQNGSGRATPRTTTTGTAWNPAYTAQRAQPAATSLMNVMSNDSRHAPNGGSDGYTAPPIHSGYPSQYPSANTVPSAKRGRDDEDEQDYARHRDGGADDLDGLKRRKTMREDSVGGGAVGSPFSGNGSIQRSQQPTVQQRRR